MNVTRPLALVAIAVLAATPAIAKPAKPHAAPAVAPEPVCETKTTAWAGPMVQPAGDIVDTLKASGQFTSFLKAADATNITLLLKQQKNLTVFAPTDAAFQALPAGDLEKLMAPANRAQLQKLLIYHMINARVPSSEFSCAVRSAPTVAGLPVQLAGDQVYKVNDANVLQADVMALNGVIFVVDKVLTPGWTPPAPAPAQ